MSKPQAARFAKIPHELLEAGLGAHALAVYAAIARYADFSTGICSEFSPSLKKIGEITGLCKNSVRKALAVLQASGFLRIRQVRRRGAAEWPEYQLTGSCYEPVTGASGEPVAASRDHAMNHTGSCYEPVTGASGEPVAASRDHAMNHTGSSGEPARGHLVNTIRETERLRDKLPPIAPQGGRNHRRSRKKFEPGIYDPTKPPSGNDYLSQIRNRLANGETLTGFEASLLRDIDASFQVVNGGAR